MNRSIQTAVPITSQIINYHLVSTYSQIFVFKFCNSDADDLANMGIQLLVAKDKNLSKDPGIGDLFLLFLSCLVCILGTKGRIMIRL